MKPTPTDYAIKENETVEDICGDFTIPGALVNRLVCDPNNNKPFIESTRKAMKLAVDYLVATPEESNSPEVGEAMIVELQKTNLLISDYAAKRLSKLGVLLSKPEIFGEYIELPEEGSAVTDAPDGFDKIEMPDEASVAALRFKGCVADLMDVLVGMASGNLEFAKIQGEVLGGLPEPFKSAPAHARFAVSICASAVKIMRDNQVSNQKRIQFGVDAFIEAMLSARDISNLVSLLSPATIQELFVTRATAAISGTLGTDAKVMRLGSEEDVEQALNDFKNGREDNVVQFPHTNTVH